MSTAVAAPPVTAPHTTPPTVEPIVTARPYTAIAPSSAAQSVTPTSKSARANSNGHSPIEPSSSRSSGESKRSPTTRAAPLIVVKKEPSSPDLSTTRHRPRKLDLSGNVHNSGPGRPSAPLTAKDSAGLVMQDVGLACLSPGFHTQDPSMREQLQRSIDVRERQRQIIEARQKGHREPDGHPNTANPFRNGGNTAGLKTPGTSRRKGPPPGLTIAPPSHQQFANERVIQTAPVNQSFTGLNRQQLQPASRHVANAPSGLALNSHIHHVPANQTNNRLPPISDVFAGEIPGSSHGGPKTGGFFNNSPGNSSHSNVQPPLHSPGFGHGQSQPPHSATGRPREYKSAEEAVHSMANGREELLPRIVHYGGHQPPTPPSPMPKHSGSSHSSHGGMQTQYASTPNGNLAAPPTSDLHRSGSGRRRGRDEYERDMGTPPLRRERTGPFGEGRDSPETMRRKKEEFVKLCERAWDLFHS